MWAVGFGVTSWPDGSPGWLVRRHTRELPRDGFLLVTLVWVVLPARAAAPLMWTVPRIEWADAYFEAMSALTATGATALAGLDQLPLSVNIWRCFLQFIGGLGIILLVVAVPLLGLGGMQLYRAEVPGPLKDDKLTPRIAETARGLWTVYFVLSAACLVAYRAAGMDWPDAFMHMCTTMGLGGLLARRQLRPLRFTSDRGRGHRVHDAGRCELPALLRRLADPFATRPGARLGSAGLCPGDPAGRVRHQLRAAVARGSTTAIPPAAGGGLPRGFPGHHHRLLLGGLSSGWPPFAPVLMIFLGCFASCAGSTGGGIKMVRMILLLKQAQRELVRIIHPRVVNPVTMGGASVPATVLAAVLAFMLIYGASIIGLTLLMLLSGLDLITAFSAVIVCVNNIGPGLGMVGPINNFGILNDFQLWVLSFAMLLGRLELMSVLVLFTARFWGK